MGLLASKIAVIWNIAEFPLFFASIIGKAVFYFLSEIVNFSPGRFGKKDWRVTSFRLYENKLIRLGDLLEYKSENLFDSYSMKMSDFACFFSLHVKHYLYSSQSIALPRESGLHSNTWKNLFHSFIICSLFKKMSLSHQHSHKMSWLHKKNIKYVNVGKQTKVCIFDSYLQWQETWFGNISF